MTREFDLDDVLAPALVLAATARHGVILRGLALAEGYRGAQVADISLCDRCMDAFDVDKLMAGMGHTDEEGGVRCHGCGRFEARLCFSVKSGV